MVERAQRRNKADQTASGRASQQRSRDNNEASDRDGSVFGLAQRITTPVSLAALGMVVVYALYRAILGLHVFGNLSGDQTFQIINQIASSMVVLAVVLALVGATAYAYTTRLGVTPASAQTLTITGNVLSPHGLPIPGAIVFVEGVDGRKPTDENGWFQLRVEERPSYRLRAFTDAAATELVVQGADWKTPARLVLETNIPNPTPADQQNSADQPAKTVLYCSFCGKSQHEVAKLIAADKVFICDECTDLCATILDEEEQKRESRVGWINELCELTWVLADPALALPRRIELQDQADTLSGRLRSSRRERPGDTIANAKLTRVVGNGNFSTVWEARQLGADGIETGQRVAVKIFDQNKLTQGLMLWRFLRGIRAMQHLNGQGKIAPRSIVRILSAEDRALAFSMEFLPGGDLEKIRQRGWSGPKKLEIFGQIAAAVAFAHGEGIVHRDIKPANIVLNEDGNAVLTDFDIADLHFARTQSIYAGSLGTPQFAAPEQLVGQTEKAFPTADIYSLGKLLYFLMIEAAPPMGSTESDRVPPYLGAIADETLRNTIHRAISHQPDDRVQSVAALMQGIGASGLAT